MINILIVLINIIVCGMVGWFLGTLYCTRIKKEHERYEKDIYKMIECRNIEKLIGNRLYPTEFSENFLKIIKDIERKISLVDKIDTKLNPSILDWDISPSDTIKVVILISSILMNLRYIRKNNVVTTGLRYDLHMEICFLIETLLKIKAPISQQEILYKNITTPLEDTESLMGLLVDYECLSEEIDQLLIKEFGDYYLKKSDIK